MAIGEIILSWFKVPLPVCILHVEELLICMVS